jgi:hypothetical protein
MARSFFHAATPGAPPAPEVFEARLKEIGMFFQERGQVHKSLRRLVKNLENVKIPYAVMGAMAVNAHGARRTTDDVDVLLTPTGFERFHSMLVGRHYDRVPGRPRRFVDRKNGVGVDVLVTGRYPGTGKPGPIAFPDPEEASEVLGKFRVITLPQLVQLKLAARRHYDFGDVVYLIRVHDLNESFKERIHPSVHGDYIECLEEKRREDEYEAREGEEI